MPETQFAYSARSAHQGDSQQLISKMDFERLNRAIGYDQLSLEEKVRRAVRAAKLEMTPRWTEICHHLTVAQKMKAANEMFVYARRQLYFQEIRKGLSQSQAQMQAAKRILNGNDW